MSVFLSSIYKEHTMESNSHHNFLKVTPRLEYLGLEDVLPRGEITLYVATWNMNCKDPPTDLNDFIPSECRNNLPEILVFGTQECTAGKSDWEVGLQRAIGPTHVLYHTTVKKHSGIRLAIFMNRGLIWFCSEPDVETILLSWSTRSTKGAVSISFELLGSSFLFIACHLAAHEENLENRLEHIKDITKAFTKDYEVTDLGEKFDYIFWSGDMNFRISRPRGEVLKWVSSNEFPLTRITQHLPGEQLRDVIQEGITFKGYREHLISFPPTYKFDVGTDVYDTSHKLRTPSYTDRIIYKSRKGLDAIRCYAYDSIPTLRTSDHKPVYGLFKVKVSPGVGQVSPTAGYFHRKVYLAAMKEDDNNDKPNEK